MKQEPITIYCPACGRKTGTHDGKGTLHIKTKCKKCQKLVVYFPESKQTLLKLMPPRATSSGMRFY